MVVQRFSWSTWLRGNMGSFLAHWEAQALCCARGGGYALHAPCLLLLATWGLPAYADRP